MSDVRAWLGRSVEIQIDRPLGSCHPQHGFLYPLNYGFLPGVMGKDGEALDAYLLGVFEPVKQAQGIVIAVIERLNDSDDKLVVAPPGKRYTADQITALVEFQERFFESQITLMD